MDAARPSAQIHPQRNRSPSRRRRPAECGCAAPACRLRRRRGHRQAASGSARGLTVSCLVVILLKLAPRLCARPGRHLNAVRTSTAHVNPVQASTNRLHQTINIRGQAPYRLAQVRWPRSPGRDNRHNTAPVGGFQAGADGRRTSQLPISAVAGERPTGPRWRWWRVRALQQVHWRQVRQQEVKVQIQTLFGHLGGNRRRRCGR